MNKRRIFNRLVWLVFALVLQFSIQAQNSKPPAEKTVSRVASRVQSYQLNSKLMAREMPYRVILPNGYDAKEKASVRYPVVYLLHGLSGHFDNWTDKTKLAAYAGQFDFVVVTPEGGDGWYTDSATAASDR